MLRNGTQAATIFFSAASQKLVGSTCGALAIYRAAVFNTDLELLRSRKGFGNEWSQSRLAIPRSCGSCLTCIAAVNATDSEATATVV